MMHGHGKMGATPVFNAARRSDANACSSVPHLSFFFFNGFTPTRLQFSPNQANSARIGSYRPNRSISTSGRNWPKQAEIDLESYQNSWNWLWMIPKHPKSILPQFYFEYLLLLLCFLFCFVFLAFFFLCFVNQGHIMCFLRIFLKAWICVKTQEFFRPQIKIMTRLILL